MKKHGIDVKAVDAPEEAVKGVDILVTATPSRTPIVNSSWIREGVHINSIGADAKGKQELEEDIYKHAKVVVDNVDVALAKGLFDRGNIYAELGQVIVGEKKGRETPTEITLFDSSGIGIQDIAAARIVYERAKKTGVGRWSKFI